MSIEPLDFPMVPLHLDFRRQVAIFRLRCQNEDVIEISSTTEHNSDMKIIDPDRKVEQITHALEGLNEHETACRLCPRRCGIDRSHGEKGFCGSPWRISLSHHLLHFGEEPVISGAPPDRTQTPRRHQNRRGSGTLFFSGCSLKCVFCQNFQLSWQNRGVEITPEALAARMLDLQEQGAWNINLVSPSHQLVPILQALREAYRQGLSLPLVYNTHGYEVVDILKRLDGIVDIYLPDLKYHSPALSERLCRAKDYFAYAGPALQEMQRQQPGLILDSHGMAVKGVLVRHLVLPGQVPDSLAILKWMSAHMTGTTGLSLMSQYHPCHQAPEDLRRNITAREYRKVLQAAESSPFEIIFTQPEFFAPHEHLMPDFNRDDPFIWDP